MARRTKAEAAATREALLDAAEEVFLEKGVARTSLEQIARHAGMTRGAVYWHFRNKADLFRAMLGRVRVPFQELVREIDDASLSERPLEAIRLALLKGFERLEQPRYRRVHAILIHHCEVFGDIDPLAMQNEMAEDALGALLSYFECAARRQQLRPGLTAEVAAQLMQSLLSGLYHDWLRNEERYSLLDQGGRLVACQLSLLASDQAPPQAHLTGSTPGATG
ncbi:transcriptional regulator, TetR family [Halomonas shengliensis]|uniref:Transcriptional regulator, TetR family n=1 Tax=Halomonas shengliensis TaxID=419597 RepID=A0A1H0DSB6_9GAMM|nr:TetR family transcriptional regulator [Halomonas shengliensis]SDN72933.1 transcriptional regulator, TetR family [Halomonas shengliensis]